MKKLLLNLDDETFNLLKNDTNKSATIREAIKYIKLDISPDTINGLRRSYGQVARKLADMDAKLDYIAKIVDGLKH